MRQPANRDKDLIGKCYERSVQLLKKNCTPLGISAATKSKKADSRHYASIFGRDAAICSLGMAVSGEAQLRACAKRSLLTLGKYQAPNGQIPKFVTPETEEVDFWYAGCIDATLWWLIAVDFYDRHVPEDRLKSRLHKQIELAVYWLQCQEHQSLHLVQQNEASDWADIMPRSGFVLYSNALWYRVKKLYAVPHTEKTRHNFKLLFYPYNKAVSENRRARILSRYVKEGKKRSDCYLSFVNLSFWGPELDVYANILSMLFGLSPKSKSLSRVNELISLKANEPFPVKSVLFPIRQNSPLWRTYMERHEQNFPHQYHNGGIWPYVAGFWIMLLLRLNRKKCAHQELDRFARVNSLNNWEFNEWFHGKTGEPMGMAGQSWNAAMFILAYHCMQDTIDI
jgi:glycogen debranching enzyme